MGMRHSTNRDLVREYENTSTLNAEIVLIGVPDDVHELCSFRLIVRQYSYFAHTGSLCCSKTLTELDVILPCTWISSRARQKLIALILFRMGTAPGYDSLMAFQCDSTMYWGSHSGQEE